MVFCIFLLCDCTKHEDELYIYAKVENASDYDDVVDRNNDRGVGNNSKKQNYMEWSPQLKLLSHKL